MRQMRYDDGTPSREVGEEVDDWETLHDTKKKIKICTLTNIRDELNNIKSLVHVCGIALSSKNWENQPFLQARVSEVLLITVIPSLELLEHEVNAL